ncbi:MAG: hypothetical protein JWL81_1334 [Verrucomicrobiales bacterium]|nr:hypothetical protein [Verrucomicrobiales bacterium]
MIPVLLLLVSVLLFRIAPGLGSSEMVRAMAGWSPLMALALCGAAFFPRRLALAAGFAAVVIPYIVINLVQGYALWHANLPALIAVVAAVSVIGSAVGKKAPVAVFLGASLLSTVLFHLVTNTVSFFTVPGYSPTLAGWIQAQTTGLPQYSPQTWVFSARQLAGDLLFTTLFVLACRPRPAAVPAAAAAPSPACA